MYNVDRILAATQAPFMDYEPMKSAELDALNATYEGAISKVFIPQITNDDGKLWVEVHIQTKHRLRVKYYTVRAAINEFSGYLDFVNRHRYSAWLSNEAFRRIEQSIMIKARTHLKIGDICELHSDLPLILKFVVVTGFKFVVGRTCVFNEEDTHPFINVAHIDPRDDELTHFDRTTGAEFNLSNPRGTVSTHDLIKIAAKGELGYLRASRQYWKLRAESLIVSVTNFRTAFQSSMKQIFTAIGHRIRGRLTKRNESKIFSDGYVLPNIMMETTLNSKFKDITGDDPKVRGESTFNFFTPEQAALIYSDNNLSRDYNEDGKELDAATDNIDDVDYTMSVSGVLHRFVANESGRLYIRFNVIRQVAGTDDVFGVTEAWKSIEKRYK
eukprot:268297_1